MTSTGAEKAKVYTLKMMSRWKDQAWRVLNDPGSPTSLKALARVQLSDAKRIELELKP